MSEAEKVTRRGYMKYVGGIVVVAVVAAAGYGVYEATKPPPTTPSPTPTPTPTPTTPTPTTPKPGKIFEGVKITGATLAGGAKGPMCGVLYHYRDEFKEATGADLEVVEISFADLPIKILADLTTKTGAYDFFVPCSTIMGDLVAPGYVHDVGKWMADTRFPKWEPDDVAYLVAQCNVWGGKWYGVPWDSDAWYFNWNMKQMDKVLKDKAKRAEFKSKFGYELNPYGWYKSRVLTWQKVRDMCEFFTGWDWNGDGEDDYGIIMGLRTGEQGTFWYEPFAAPFVASYGDTIDRYHNVFWFDPESMDPYVKTAGFAEAAKLFKEINTKFSSSAALTFTFAETWDYFLNKQKAMFTLMPPDTFTLVGNPEKSTIRGFLMTTPSPGSDKYWDLKESRWVEKVNNSGNAAGCSWHPWISTLSKNPEAAYWFSAYVATPEKHRETTASAYFWTGVDPGFISDLLTDYGGTATLADYKLPGNFVDPGYPAAYYEERDLRRAHIAVMNNFFAADVQYGYMRLPGGNAMFTAMDTHIIGELLSGAASPEEALYRSFNDFNKIVDDYGREKMKAWYHEMIGYGKPNPYKPRAWIWDDKVVSPDVIF